MATTDRLYDTTGNKKVSEPKCEIDSFQDLIYDENGKGHYSTISYEGFHYDNAFRICKLTVSTSLRHVEAEDVVNLLELREGKRIKLECNLTLI